MHIIAPHRGGAWPLATPATSICAVRLLTAPVLAAWRDCSLSGSLRVDCNANHLAQDPTRCWTNSYQNAQKISGHFKVGQRLSDGLSRSWKSGFPRRRLSQFRSIPARNGIATANGLPTEWQFERSFRTGGLKGKRRPGLWGISQDALSANL